MENESSYDGIPILSICGISLCLCEVTVTSNMHDSIMGIESSSFASKIVGLIYILLFVCLFVCRDTTYSIRTYAMHSH